MGIKMKALDRPIPKISPGWTYPEKKHFFAIYTKQEAMENFVFPDEIKTKLMKMSKLRNIFYVPYNYGKMRQAVYIKCTEGA